MEEEEEINNNNEKNNEINNEINNNENAGKIMIKKIQEEEYEKLNEEEKEAVAECTLLSSLPPSSLSPPQLQFVKTFRYFQTLFHRSAYEGGRMMERVRAMSEENAMLAERIDLRNAENENLLNQIANFDLDRTNLILQFQSLVQNMQEENAKIPELLNEKNAAISNCEELKGQLNDAIETNKSLLDDLKLKNDQLQKYKYLEKENADISTHSKSLSLSIENLQNEMNKYKEDNIELKKELAHLKSLNSSFSDTISNLELELANKKKESQSRDRDHLKAIGELNHKIRELNAEIEKKEQKIDEMKMRMETYTKQTTFTALENQKLTKDISSQFKLLDQYRLALDALKRDAQKREEEPIIIAQTTTGGGNITQKGEIDQSGGSLFDDIADEINDFTPSTKYDKYDHQLESSNNNNLNFIRLDDENIPPGAPENCQEFFFLAATAVKISLAIKSPITSDDSFKINLRELYDKAIRTEIPFHEWYEWIVRELSGQSHNPPTKPNSPIVSVPPPIPRSSIVKGAQNPPITKPPPKKPPPKKSFFW